MCWRVEELREQSSEGKKLLPTTQRLAPAVRIDETDGHEVALGHAARLGDRKRILEDWLYRPPHVDDLDAAFQQPLRLGRQMVRDAIARGGVRLVDVDPGHGAAQRVGGGGGGGVGWGPSDRVVEDEYPARARAGMVTVLSASTRS